MDLPYPTLPKMPRVPGNVLTAAHPSRRCRVDRACAGSCAGKGVQAELAVLLRDRDELCSWSTLRLLQPDPHPCSGGLARLSPLASHGCPQGATNWLETAPTARCSGTPGRRTARRAHASEPETESQEQGGSGASVIAANANSYANCQRPCSRMPGPPSASRR